MKTLQNNFTTPEQSKRLLELGVPADTADCVWYNPYYDGDRPELAEIHVWKGKYPQRVDKYTLPCWSVGRLMEILSICCSYRHYLPVDCCFVEYIVCIITNEIKLDRIDFSKLEE